MSPLMASVELEVEVVEILRNRGGVGGLRNHGATVLDAPAEHDLRRRLAMGFWAMRPMAASFRALAWPLPR
jgi:hypothetical protein